MKMIMRAVKEVQWGRMRPAGLQFDMTGFCDNSTRVSVIKSVSMGGGWVKKCYKLNDVINGQPLKSFRHLRVVIPHWDAAAHYDTAEH
jgi:hypothetical protein